MPRDYEVSTDSRYYWVGQEWLPRVSTILDDCGFTSHWCKDAERAERGTNGHSWVESVLSGRTPEDPGSAAPLVRCIESWAERENVRPLVLPDGLSLASEMPVHFHNRFAGRMDVLTEDLVLWDVKFWAQPSKIVLYSAGIQTSAYEAAVKALLKIRKGITRIIAWFHIDGEEYKCESIPLKDPADWPTFQSAVNVWWARKTNNLL